MGRLVTLSCTSVNKKISGAAMRQCNCFFKYSLLFLVAFYAFCHCFILEENGFFRGVTSALATTAEPEGETNNEWDGVATLSPEENQGEGDELLYRNSALATNSATMEGRRLADDSQPIVAFIDTPLPKFDAGRRATQMKSNFIVGTLQGITASFASDTYSSFSQLLSKMGENFKNLTYNSHVALWAKSFWSSIRDSILGNNALSFSREIEKKLFDTWVRAVTIKAYGIPDVILPSLYHPDKDTTKFLAECLYFWIQMVANDFNSFKKSSWTIDNFARMYKESKYLTWVNSLKRNNNLPQLVA